MEKTSAKQFARDPRLCEMKLADLLGAGGSREEKRQVVDALLRDLLGDRPDDATALYNPDGTVYVYVVPPARYIRLEEPDRLAELERRQKEVRSQCGEGKARAFADIINSAESRASTP